MPQCFRPTALAIALVVVLPAKVALAADGPDWSLCGVNTLFEFYTPGLPTEVDRTLAPTDFDAVSVGVEGPPEARECVFLSTVFAAVLAAKDPARGTRLVRTVTELTWSKDGIPLEAQQLELKAAQVVGCGPNDVQVEVQS